MTHTMRLPEGWETTRIGELAEVLRGVTYKKAQSLLEERSGFVPLLRATNIDRELGLSDFVYVPRDLVKDKQMLQPGDSVIAASSGSLSVVGKSAPLHHEWEGTFGAFCFALRPNPSAVVPLYLAHYLQTTEYRTTVSKLAAGVNINNLKRQHLEDMPIPYAPSSEQHRIVEAIESYLTRLDAAVASLKRVQKNLKRYRASVLKAAVEGRLVPTEAELAKKEGRNYEPASELLKRILVERRKKWIENAAEKARAKAEEKARKAGKPWTHADDVKTLEKERVKAVKKYKEPAAPDLSALGAQAGTSNLPDLPEGWCWATVANLSFDVTYGSSSKTSNEGTDGVPVLRMGNIAEGRIDLSDLKYLSQEHSEFPRLFLAPGDLLFNRTNSAELVGKTAVYRGQPSPCSFASYLIRVRLTEGSESEYVAAYINSAFGRQWISSVVSQQVGQANVNGTKLRACVIPLPPIQEQKRISSTLEETVTLVKSIESTVEDAKRRSSKLRQSILKWAFEGKLVNQDQNDEPASVLLERIKAERESMQPRKKRRTNKKKQPTKHDEQLDLLGGSNT